MAIEEKISFTNARGQTLKGVLHRPEQSEVQGAVILCHGMESSKESEKLVYLGRALALQGISALRFDFACAGESSGKFEDITYSSEAEDLKAAFSFMLDGRVRRIAILGSSMGGTAALLFAAQEPRVAALVTVSAPVHPEKFPTRLLTPDQLAEWRAQGHIVFRGQRLNVSLLEDLERLDVPAAAKQVACPVLVIHGAADLTVPVEEAEELERCLPGKKQLLILKGADHRFSEPELMKQAIAESIDWIVQHVR